MLGYYDIHIEDETYYWGNWITGLLAAVQPMNDLFMLSLIFCTSKISFLGNKPFFKFVTGFVPLALVTASWLGTQAVTVYNNSFYDFPVAQLIMSKITFAYFIYPTLLVTYANFYA